jgi:hypothetical protein
MNEQSNNPFNLPTERIDLPSKGLLYPRENPLSQGYVEITYPTAKHEDILTNMNFIKKGVAQENFLKALIVSKIDYKDLLQGDKDALMVAARILAFGKDYSFTRDNVKYTADLTTLEDKPLNEELFKSGVNEFDFYLPTGKLNITVKFLTMRDEEEMEKEEENMKKIFPNFSGDSTIFLRQSIVSINGSKDKGPIHKLSESMLMQDSKALKKFIAENKPGLNMITTVKTDKGEVVEGFRVPFTIDFFWPND